MLERCRSRSNWAVQGAMYALLAGAAGELRADDARAIASDLALAGGEQRVVFVTTERLVPTQDADADLDIYVRRTLPNGTATTELVSQDESDPFAGEGWVALGARQGLVYGFERNPPFGPRPIFVFVRRFDGVWLRGVSVANSDATPKDVLDDGSLIVRAFDRLAPGDTDLLCDLYHIPRPSFAAGPGGTVLGPPTTPVPAQLTRGSGGDELECPLYGGGFMSPTGDLRVVFETDRRLVPLLDRDSAVDVYVRSVGAAGTFNQLLSRGAAPSIAVESPAFMNTRDGSQSQFKDDFGDAVGPAADTVIFQTAERLVAADTDSAVDFYVGIAGVATPVLVPGNGVAKLVVNGFVFFESTAPLAGNLDEDIDVFRMNLATGALLHVSRARTFPGLPLPPEFGSKDAGFTGASELGNRAWFRSFGDFGVSGASGENDDDLYEANLSLAPGSEDFLRRLSRSRSTFPGRVLADPVLPSGAAGQQINSMFLGRTVLFRSIRQLAPQEDAGEGDADVYAFWNGTPRLALVTTTTSSDPHPELNEFRSVLGFGGTAFARDFLALPLFQPERGSDPTTVVFESDKPLAPTDTDSDIDVYVRDLATSTTTHVSVEP